MNIKNFFIIIGITVVILVTYFYLSIDPKKSEESLQDQVAVYSDSELGLEFKYRPGPQGYVLQETKPSHDSGDLLRSIVMFRAQDTKNMPENSEGPPTITIDIFKNTKKEHPNNWIHSHTQYSSINLIQGTTSESVVGGANAVKYIADGLYASEKIAVAHGGNIYLFSGSFIDQHSDLRRDFAPLVQSVRFIERPEDNAPTAKININAVCEGALTYMTFADGKAADAFLAECKEGRRPEVIERYKNSLNLDGSVI